MRYENVVVFLPVTRPWAVKPVVEALDGSDAPRNIVLLLDAPDCWGWLDAFAEREWRVQGVVTGRVAPPTDRAERRGRHLLMRQESRRLLKGYDRVLCVEDDTIVPTDVWERLSLLVDSGYEAATGIQYTKGGSHIPGVWRYDRDLGLYDPVWGEGHGECDACGLYALMTTGERYARQAILPGRDEPIDRAQTKFFAPIGVDFDCVCGHLKEDGTVIS